jgi:hypothetical protein
MHQYAYHPQQGKSIHSSCQLESFANDVNDKSIHIPGGLQRIQTIDGYVFPLSIRDGLPYLVDMQPYTDSEYNSLPHVILTSDIDWDPHVLDFNIDDNADWYDAISDNVNHSDIFDVFDNYKGREAELEVSSADIWLDTITPDQYARAHLEGATFVCSEHVYGVRNFDNKDIDNVLLVNDTDIINATDTAMDDDEEPPALISKDEMSNHDSDSDDDDDDDDDTRAHTFKVQTPDYDKLRRLFGWMPTKTVKKTFETTTPQYARMPNSTILKKQYKSPFPESPFPALNVKCRADDEPVATDTVFSDTPAIDSGERCAQIFVGTETLVTDVYGITSNKGLPVGCTRW